jgi:hypothetical protein
MQRKGQDKQQDAKWTYPDTTPVLIDPGGACGDGGDAAGGAAASSLPPPFEYVQRVPLPANAVDGRGGCSCT